MRMRHDPGCRRSAMCSICINMQKANESASKSRTDELTVALMLDDVKKLQSLIISDPSLVNQQISFLDGYFQWTPLGLAMHYDSINSLEILIKEGADPYCSSHLNERHSTTSYTPFAAACTGMPNRMRALRKLLELGVYVDQPIPGNPVGKEERVLYGEFISGLHYAVCTQKSQLVQLLLDYGASVKTLDVNGNSPLHVACENCYSDARSTSITRTILSYGGISNITNTEFLSPMGILWNNNCYGNCTEIANLFKYMKSAGYDYHTDAWYVNKFSGGRLHTCIIEVLQCLACHLLPVFSESLSLKASARVAIRRRLSERHTSITRSVVNQLPLPDTLKPYVAMMTS